MYARILKKDLKRKRTMNVILLLFVILAGTFISSSVNSIITIRNAIDDYFEKAGAPDFVAATMGKMGGRPIFESFWRGANVKSQPGSGLGLYIYRQLMHKMGGEVFAELEEDFMTVTVAFVKV